MTPDQLHILQHSLGCDAYGRPEGRGYHGSPYYRNRYVSHPTPVLTAMVQAGWLRDHGSEELTSGMHWFTVTEAGIAAMREQSPQPPKQTAGQKRYREWQHADCGLSFGEWLTAKGTRASA